MPDLQTVQNQMRDTIVSGDASAATLAAYIDDNGIDAERRLQVYRNNFRESLTEALRGIFPGAIAFIGDEFFTGIVAEFVKTSPPDRPQLSGYGGDFADFFRTFEHAKRVAYVADLMELEWAIHESQNAPNADRYSPEEALNALDTGTLSVHPSLRLVEAPTPIVSFWMVTKGQLKPELIRVDSGGEQAAVVRVDGAVQLQPLDKDDFLLLTKLAKAPVSSELGNDISRDQIAALAARGLFASA